MDVNRVRVRGRDLYSNNKIQFNGELAKIKSHPNKRAPCIVENDRHRRLGDLFLHHTYVYSAVCVCDKINAAMRTTYVYRIFHAFWHTVHWKAAVVSNP